MDNLPEVGSVPRWPRLLQIFAREQNQHLELLDFHNEICYNQASKWAICPRSFPDKTGLFRSSVFGG
jgi:hypothetical protein